MTLFFKPQVESPGYNGVLAKGGGGNPPPPPTLFGHPLWKSAAPYSFSDFHVFHAIQRKHSGKVTY